MSNELPAVLHVFAEGVEVFDLHYGTIIQRHGPAPEAVDLMGVHPHGEDVEVRVVVEDKSGNVEIQDYDVKDLQFKPSRKKEKRLSQEEEKELKELEG